MMNHVRFYWSLLLRRSPAMLALVLLCLGAAAVYALNQPNSYTAQARLLVESPQISEDLATSTVTTNTAEQLQIIQERIMRRANLIDLANKFDVFGDAADQMVPDQVVQAMNLSIQINRQVQRDQAAFVDIMFTAGDPNIAAAVVNDIVTQILDDNVRLRTERAGNTLQFFEQEVERLSTELARQSARISEFKARNSDSLPESLNFRMTRESSLEERRVGMQRELAGLEEQRQRVTAIYEETGQLRVPEDELTPEQRQLRALESELTSALAVYSESNPRVQVLQTRVEQLQKVVAGQNPVSENANPSSSIYEVTLAEIDSRADSVRAQIESVDEQLAELRDRIERTPQTTIALETLERDYENVQAQYNVAVGRLASARTGEQIELTAQGQRITVVDNAVPPEFPTSPSRKKIALAGGLAGVGAAAGLFALLEVLNTAIRRPAELVSKVGITPLATIPRIETRRQRIWRRLIQIGVVLAFFVVLPAMLYLLHSYVMPLSDLYELAKAFARGETL